MAIIIIREKKLREKLTGHCRTIKNFVCFNFSLLAFGRQMGENRWCGDKRIFQSFCIFL